jgi:hypothetical protein
MLYPCLVKILKHVYLPEVTNIVKPDTILGWHRVNKELEDWVVRMAKENRGWGYDRIAGALAELGYNLSDQTVGNILKRRGIPTAPIGGWFDVKLSSRFRFPLPVQAAGNRAITPMLTRPGTVRTSSPYRDTCQSPRSVQHGLVLPVPSGYTVCQGHGSSGPERVASRVHWRERGPA